VLESLAARMSKAAASGRPALPPAGGELRRLPGGGVDLAAAMGDGPAWVEVSPRAAGFPAACERLASAPSAGWSLPAEIRQRRPGPLVGRVVDDRGRERGRFDVAEPADAPAAASAGAGGAA
jgi:hypothetical protein